MSQSPVVVGLAWNDRIGPVDARLYPASPALLDEVPTLGGVTGLPARGSNGGGLAALGRLRRCDRECWSHPERELAWRARGSSVGAKNCPVRRDKTRERNSAAIPPLSARTIRRVRGTPRPAGDDEIRLAVFRDTAKMDANVAMGVYPGPLG